MSTFKVEVVPFTLEKHPNADSLSIAHIRGWQAIVRTEEFLNETLGVYVPLDGIADKDHPLLSFLEGKKVKTIKLRKIISQGVLLPASKVRDYLSARGQDYILVDGMDLQYDLEIKKWEMPRSRLPTLFGKNSPDSVQLPATMNKYTDIENIKNYPDVFKDNDEVTISEKLHGTSARYCLHKGNYYIASRNVGLHEDKKLNAWEKFKSFFFNKEKKKGDSVWHKVSETHDIKNRMLKLSKYLGNPETLIVYGEIVGESIQDLHYGFSEPTLFLYDIKVDDSFLNSIVFKTVALEFFERICPTIYDRILFRDVNLSLLSNGKSQLTDKHCREGVIIKSVLEMHSNYIGRKILKSIGDDYYMRNNATDN